MSFTIPFIISPSKTNVRGVTFHNDAQSQGCIYERGSTLTQNEDLSKKSQSTRRCYRDSLPHND